MSNLSNQEQSQFRTWLGQNFPGYVVDFNNQTITGGSTPLSSDQINQINNHVSQNYGSSMRFSYSNQTSSSSSS
jgi:ABC-type transporter MlaC component